jgi:hypothetical protein
MPNSLLINKLVSGGEGVATFPFLISVDGKL